MILPQPLCHGWPTTVMTRHLQHKHNGNEYFSGGHLVAPIWQPLQHSLLLVMTCGESAQPCFNMWLLHWSATKALIRW